MLDIMYYIVNITYYIIDSVSDVIYDLEYIIDKTDNTSIYCMQFRFYDA